MKKLLPFCIACLLFIVSAKAQLVSYHLQQSFTKQQLDSFLNTTGFSLPVSPKYDIDVYEVIYKTPYKHVDSLVNCSGIVVIPKGVPCGCPLGCYAHGTFTQLYEVPSHNGPERPIGFFFAGLGGVVTAMSDEIGLGDGDTSKVIIQTYINAFHGGYASVNAMRAARQLADTLGIALNGEVALTGYSQGGYTTMATAKLIQDNFSNEFNVVAIAPMSGPYDLNVTMVNQMLSTAPYATPSYLPLLLLGYHSVYPSLQQLYPNPADIFKHPYDSILPPMYYSKQYSTNDINNFCAPVPRDMIKDSILADFINNPNHPLRLVLNDNDMLGWAPQKPVKIAYCTADEQVNYHNAIQADSAWVHNGAPSVTIDNDGNTNHAGCVQPAITNAALFILGQFTQCTGVQQVEQFKFNLFPNPTTGTVCIAKPDGDFNMTLTDMNGRILYSTALKTENTYINLGDLPGGIYMFELTNNKGEKVYRKLIKQ